MSKNRCELFSSLEGGLFRASFCEVVALLILASGAAISGEHNGAFSEHP
jgi:hypothetical protein